MTNKNGFIKKTVFMFGSNAIGKGSMFLANILMARFLGIEIYGEFIFVFSIIMIIALIPRLGLDQSLLKYIPMNTVSQREDLNKEISTFSVMVSIIVSIIICLLLVIFPNSISILLLGNIKYSNQLVLQSGLIPLVALIFVVPSIYQARKQIYLYSLQINIGRYVVFALAMYILYILGAEKSYIPVLSKYLALLLTVVLGFSYGKKKNFFSRLKKENVLYYNEFLRFSIPFFLTGSLGVIMNKINVYMVGYFLDSESVAIYNSASQIAIITSFMLLSVNQVFAPIISQLHHEDNYKKLNRIYGQINVGLTIISIILMSIIFIANEQIMLVFGEEYMIGGKVLIIVSAGQVFNAMSGPCGYILSMTGHQKVNLYINIVMLLVTIVLNIILIPSLSYIGAAISSAIASVLINLLRVIFMYRFTKIIPFKFWAN